MYACRPLQCVDVRKQNLFLFLHMHDHLSPNFGEESPDISNFGVTLSVLCFYLVQQGLNPSDCVTNVPMVSLTDMPCQITQQCQCPVRFVGTYVFAVFTQPLQAAIAGFLIRASPNLCVNFDVLVQRNSMYREAEQKSMAEFQRDAESQVEACRAGMAKP